MLVPAISSMNTACMTHLALNRKPLSPVCLSGCVETQKGHLTYKGA